MNVADLFKYLRVVDVVDAMDGIGYFGSGLMDPEVRPLWLGMRFWGPAVTLRCVPSNRPMWKLDTTEDIVADHARWYARYPSPVNIREKITPGCVLVTDTGGAKETGYWGSNNSMGIILAGAVGLVTDGQCRDTYELALQKTPICSRGRGRTIIPGRIMEVEANVPIGCGGVQVCPGDVVGCDDDGVVVVPQDVAEEVGRHAVAILLSDMRGRSNLYGRLGLPKDDTVDVATVEAYYQALL
ncbi:MAG: RraA family protein [Anaerolineae bacterium]|jgi:4-hydroxy-4-methyl-2-oxoglutarate aldolase|nr:RraA family protein [Chloroflexota bacterium]